MNRKTYIVSRHQPAQQWLAGWLEKHGFVAPQLVEHIGDDFWSKLREGDIVLGTLPLHLAARAAERTGNPFGFLSLVIPKEERGAELTSKDMERFGATLRWFRVEETRLPHEGPIKKGGQEQ